ncbi:hypothetical protein [Taibaiella soli]|uniref:Lipocalin-like domain-containing protein n=1 Tax=Taibaiella soli TaxID=1649169 RepID=A0A2W2AK72_9BACT|nr:hypothetical protein [Taibaiella soli]PZF73962.1 hypothetical protein DN068_06385 [Taibaiella soli]
MKALQIAVFSLFALVFASCKQMPHIPSHEELVGLWSISSAKSAHNEGYRLAEQVAYFNLRADGSYTGYLPDYFDYGHWKYRNESGILTLTSERPITLYNKKWVFEVSNYANNLFNAHITGFNNLLDQRIPNDANRERITFRMANDLVFQKEKVQYDAQHDPYSLANSRWRLHPDHEESCAEIKERIINHLNHLALIFEGYKNHKDDDVIQADHSPNPFIMAVNGVQLQSYASISQSYNNTFFNRANEYEAYHLLENSFGFQPIFPKDRNDYAALWATLFYQTAENARKTDICAEFDKRVQKYKADSTAKASAPNAEPVMP